MLRVKGHLQASFVVAFIFTATQQAAEDDVVKALPLDTVSLFEPLCVQAHLRVARSDALSANGSSDPSIPGRAELATI